MSWPLAVAVALSLVGMALLAAARAAGRRSRRTEVVPMNLRNAFGDNCEYALRTARSNSSSALFTPSQLREEAVAAHPRAASMAVAPEPESAPPEPAARVPDEAKLSAKQRERLERLMAAVKAEFNTLLDQERNSQED